MRVAAASPVERAVAAAAAAAGTTAAAETPDAAAAAAETPDAAAAAAAAPHGRGMRAPCWRAAASLARQHSEMEWQPSRPPAAAPQVVALNVGETVGERGTCNLSQRRAAHARMRDAGTAAFARERQPRS